MVASPLFVCFLTPPTRQPRPRISRTLHIICNCRLGLFGVTSTSVSNALLVAPSLPLFSSVFLANKAFNNFIFVCGANHVANPNQSRVVKEQLRRLVCSSTASAVWTDKVVSDCNAQAAVEHRVLPAARYVHDVSRSLGEPHDAQGNAGVTGSGGGEVCMAPKPRDVLAEPTMQ